MPTPISAAYAELINIVNAAKWHKQNCVDPHCNVTLYGLGMTAKRLIPHCWMAERAEARRLIHETDWT